MFKTKLTNVSILFTFKTNHFKILPQTNEAFSIVEAIILKKSTTTILQRNETSRLLTLSRQGLRMEKDIGKYFSMRKEYLIEV